MKYFFLFIFCCWCLGNLSARSLQVGKTKPFSTIKGALLVAKDGDTILVEGGVYREGHIVVEKKVMLLGIHQPVLDGEKKYEVLTIRASGVVLRGFKVIHSARAMVEDPCGIRVKNSRDVVIENNVLDGNFFGIFLENSSYCTLQNNIIHAYEKRERAAGNGIHCWQGSHLRIRSNVISGHRDGIYLEFISHSLIEKNRSDKNVRYGLHFMLSNDDTYQFNSFNGNGSGVAVMFSKRVAMLNNRFEDNWGVASYALLLKELSDSQISRNQFKKNAVAILLDGASRMMVTHNDFVENGWGMKMLASSTDNTITQNNFIDNTFDMTTNGTLVLNTFDRNYWSKYEGYDLNKDQIGDVPFHPLSLFAALVEKHAMMILFFKSFLMTLIDQSEKMFPVVTPHQFIDHFPLMHRVSL